MAETVVDHVVEQRISNLAQGLLTLGTMTGPLLFVLGLIPQAVGITWYISRAYKLTEDRLWPDFSSSWGSKHWKTTG